MVDSKMTAPETQAPRDETRTLHRQGFEIQISRSKLVANHPQGPRARDSESRPSDSKFERTLGQLPITVPLCASQAGREEFQDEA